MFRKYIIIILSLIISVFFFVGCGQQMTDEQYNQLESDFYKVYDPIVKDFYGETLQVSNGQEKLSDLLDINHGKDIDKLNQLLSANINNIPENKKEDYKKISNACKQLVSLKIYSSVPYSNDSKDKIISLCKDFINFNKDRLNKLGVDGSSKEITTTNNDNIKSDLELIDKSTKYENGMTYIVGTIKNNTNKTYSLATVSINLYDKDNNQIGSTLDNIANFEGRGTWKFKCSTSVNFDKYKIVSISGN